MMDEDHINRRLTPLAVRENDGGYLDIINGPVIIHVVSVMPAV